MIGRIDPEGVETRVIHELIDFVGKDVLEIGCGDGRMTWRFADVAASVLAFDSDESAITMAREETRDALKFKLSFHVADTTNIKLAQGDYDVAVFSWSI